MLSPNYVSGSKADSLWEENPREISEPENKA